MPKRKEPLSNAIIAKILKLPNGMAMGRKLLNWDSPFFTVFKAILCAGFSSGMRKAEMTLATGGHFDATHLSRASVTWIIKGCPVASPTGTQLKALVRDTAEGAGDWRLIRHQTGRRRDLPFRPALWLEANMAPCGRYADERGASHRGYAPCGAHTELDGGGRSFVFD